MAEAEFEGVAREVTLNDPLLECLVIITKLKERPYSADSLKAGLPLIDSHFTPNLFIRAAQRAGLNAKVVRRPLNKISSLVLPAVLLLNNGQACVYRERNSDGSAQVIFPEMGDEIARVDLDNLAKEYSGYAIFIQTHEEFETRAEEEKFNVNPRNWFWGTLWRFKRVYFQVILAALFINLFALATPLFVMNVYDRVVPNNAIETLWVLAIGVLIVFSFDFILRTLRGYFIDLAGKKVDIILASALFQQVLGIQMKVRPASTGVQANHLRDFENVRDFFTSATIASIVDLPFIFLFIWIIYLLAGSIALIPLIAIPLVVIVAVLISIPLNRAVAKSFVGSSQKHAILIESLGNLDVIKSVSAEGLTLGRWEKYVGITAEAGLKSRFYSTLAVNFTTVVHYGVTVAVVVFGVYMIEKGDLTVGGLIASTILSGRALAPLGQITSLLTRYQLTKLSLQALNNVMDMPLERPTRHKFLHRPKFDGEIEFEEVSFKYPEQEMDLFKSLSFKIKSGKKVGIIGSMGSGKSTLQKLLMGFYAPDSGAIRIDGTDMSQIDPADLRRHIGYVQQEPKLFFGTVRDNIAMKAPWVEDQAILEAATLSGAHQFIARHPSGYDMPVGESGAGLSGGQCQSITIARAILLSPTMLLLDEPTSSMDNSTEHAFIRNIKESMQEKTVLLVTHKMSLLDLVDRLLVLQNGKVVADGPKQQVLEFLTQLNKERDE